MTEMCGSRAGVIHPIFSDPEGHLPFTGDPLAPFSGPSAALPCVTQVVLDVRPSLEQTELCGSRTSHFSLSRPTSAEPSSQGKILSGLGLLNSAGLTVMTP